MATKLEKSETPQITGTKLSQFVSNRLSQVGTRLQRQDFLVTTLWLMLGTVSFLTVIMIIDSIYQLSSTSRVIAWLGGVGVGLAYLCFRLHHHILLQINPYYAARRLESTIGDAKESVINWLDLQDQEIPGAIRNAVGHQAIKDLSRASIDEATKSREPATLATAFGVGLGLLFLAFLWSPGQIQSLAHRAFYPFDEVPISTRTKIELISPKDGHTTVTEGEAVQVRVKISGLVPGRNDEDAPKLQFRYNQNDPYATRPLKLDANEEWTTTLAPDQILGSGVYYKVHAGDAETSEYLISLYSPIGVKKYILEYAPRPYRLKPKYVQQFPNLEQPIPQIEEYAGTEVKLTVHANTSIRSGYLELRQPDGKILSLAGEKLPAEPMALEFRWILTKSNGFRVVLEDESRETQTSQSFFPVKVLADTIPEVEITDPGKDVSIPANGVLPLQGMARDDFGLKSMDLMIQQIKSDNEAVPLQKMPFQLGNGFQFVDGGYPKQLVYSDIIYPTKLTYQDGNAVSVKAGMVFEYWLQAQDNSDFPISTGQVGVSKKYRFTIEKSADAEQEKQKQQDAERQKQQQQKNQEQRLSEENQDRKQNQGQKGDKSGQGKGDSGNEAQNDFQKKLDELQKQLDQNNDKNGKTNPQQSEKSEGNDNKTPDQQKDNSQGTANDKQDGMEKKSGGEGSSQSKTEEMKKDDGKKNGQEGSSDAIEGQKQKANDGGMNKKDDNSQSNSDGSDQKGSKSANNDPQNMKDDTSKDSPKDGDPKQGNNSQTSQGQKQKSDNDMNSKKEDEQKGNKSGDDKSGGQKDSKSGMEKSGGGSKKGPDSAKGMEEKSKQDMNGNSPDNDGKNATKKGGDPKDNSKEPMSGANDKQGQSGQKQQTDASGKNGKEQVDQPPTDGNKTAPNDTKGDMTKSGKNKGEAPEDGKNANKSQSDEQRLKDIKDLIEQNKSGIDETTKKELEDIQKSSESQQARDQARDLLKKLENQKQQPPQNATGGSDKVNPNAGGNDTNSGQKQDPNAKTPGENELGKGEKGSPGNNSSAGSGNNGDPAKGKGSASKGDQIRDKKGKGNSQPVDGTMGKRNDLDDQGKPMDPNLEFLNRAGDLQLDDIRKKLTPDVLNKLNWSQKDADDFLRQAERYQKLLQQRQSENSQSQKTGNGQGQLPGFGPREFGSRSDATQRPISNGRSLPPAEFAPAYRRLTSEID